MEYELMLQKIYHQLEEWVIMLDSPDFKDNDAGLVREEMLKLCGEIWMNRDGKTESKQNDIKDFEGLRINETKSQSKHLTNKNES